MVASVKWVDEIIDDTPYEITENFMAELFDKHNIDFIVHGDDPCLLPVRLPRPLPGPLPRASLPTTNWRDCIANVSIHLLYPAKKTRAKTVGGPLELSVSKARYKRILLGNRTVTRCHAVRPLPSSHLSLLGLPFSEEAARYTPGA